MAMHLRLRLAELVGERGEPHRLPGRGQRLDDLPGDHDGLDELGIARALLVFSAIERFGFHRRASGCARKSAPTRRSVRPPRRLLSTILRAGPAIAASHPLSRYEIQSYRFWNTVYIHRSECQCRIT